LAFAHRARVQRPEVAAIIDNAKQTAKPSLADVIRQFRESYESEQPGGVSLAQHLAMDAITECQTSALGGHVVQCGVCGTQDYVYHSCRHRSCPKCMEDETKRWLASRQDELLPVPYFHVVFMVPEGLRMVIRAHQERLFPVLMQAAANALIEVAESPDHLGGTPAVMSTLHTWSNTLIDHFHVHCLVSAGGVDDEGRWHAAKGGRLAPNSVLEKAFRTKLRKLMKRAVKGLELPQGVFDGEWKVHAEQIHHGTDTVLRYLGRSLYRGPISDHRIVKVTDTNVVFRYRGGDGRKWETMTVSGVEFLRRVLQHVWPDRIHKVRYTGLWSRKRQKELAALRQELLSVAPVESSPSASEAPASVEPSPPHWLQCPYCSGQRFIVSIFGKGTTPPPLRSPPPPATSPPMAQPP